jgi:hypothetical protein
MTHQRPPAPSHHGRPRTELAQLVARFTHASQAVVDEQYTLTAVVVERSIDGTNQTVVVELIDHGPGSGEQRWLAAAYDELSGQATGLSNWATTELALAGVHWSQLDSS